MTNHTTEAPLPTPLNERFSQRAMFARLPENNRRSMRWAYRMLRQQNVRPSIAKVLVWSSFHDGWILGHQDANEDRS